MGLFYLHCKGLLNQIYIYMYFFFFKEEMNFMTNIKSVQSRLNKKIQKLPVLIKICSKFTNDMMKAIKHLGLNLTRKVINCSVIWLIMWNPC